MNIFTSNRKQAKRSQANIEERVGLCPQAAATSGYERREGGK
jgi:hypothetical protein